MTTSHAPRMILLSLALLPACVTSANTNVSFGSQGMTALDVEGCEIDVRPPVRPKYAVSAEFVSADTVRVTLKLFAAGTFSLRTRFAGHEINYTGPHTHQFNITGWSAQSLSVTYGNTTNTVAPAAPTVNTTAGDRVEVVALPAGQVVDGVAASARVEIIHRPMNRQARALVLTIDRP